MRHLVYKIFIERSIQINISSWNRNPIFKGICSFHHESKVILKKMTKILVFVWDYSFHQHSCVLLKYYFQSFFFSIFVGNTRYPHGIIHE